MMDDEGVEYDGRHYIGNLLDDDATGAPSKTEERSVQTNSAMPATHRLYDGTDPFVAHQPTPSFLTFGSPIGPSPNQKFWPEPPPPYSPPLTHHAPFLQNYFLPTPLNAVKPTAPNPLSPLNHPTALKTCSSGSALPQQSKSPQLKKDTPVASEVVARVEKKGAATYKQKSKSSTQAVKPALKRVAQPAPRIPGLNPIEPAKNAQNPSPKVVGAKQKEVEPATDGWKSYAVGQKRKAVRSSSAENMVVAAGKAGRIRTSDPQSKGALVRGSDEKSDLDPAGAEGRFSVLKSALAASKPGPNPQQLEERKRNGSVDGKGNAPRRINNVHNMTKEGGHQDARVIQPQPKNSSKGGNKKAVARRQLTGITSLRADLAQLMLVMAIWIGETIATVITSIANSTTSMLAPAATSLGMVLKVTWKKGWKWWNRSLLSGPHQHNRRKVILRPNQHHQPRKRRD